MLCYVCHVLDLPPHLTSLCQQWTDLLSLWFRLHPLTHSVGSVPASVWADLWLTSVLIVSSQPIGATLTTVAQLMCLPQSTGASK